MPPDLNDKKRGERSLGGGVTSVTFRTLGFEQMSKGLLFGIIVLFLGIPSISGDSRCFLNRGGSSVIFFVSEGAHIGLNVGTLEIQGEVSGRRKDITLSLGDGSTAPVRIEPNSKNLTLIRRLDKEGIEGPSSATFSVLCEKIPLSQSARDRGNNDPSIQIPVTIRVIDVNDNPPRWVGGPFAINISEQTLPGSTIMTGLKALDTDQPGPHSTVAFSAIDSLGKPSPLVSFAGGGLEGRLVLSRPLDFESQPEFNVTLRVRDHGSPPLYSDTNLRVFVTDADDQNPRFKFVSYSSLLPMSPVAGSPLLIEPEPISAQDQDTGINAPLLFSMPEGRPESQFFSIEPRTGVILLKREIPSDQLLQPVTLVLKAEQVDNPDRYALSTLNVGRKGHQASPLHFVQPLFEISVPENSPPNTILLTALTSRPSDKALRFSIQGDHSGLFGVGPMGQLILKRTLDFESQQKHLLKIWVTDGFRNASSTVSINVLNENDWSPRFRQSLYEFNVTSNYLDSEDSLGQIEVADGDLGDQLTLEVKNTAAIGVDTFGRLFIANRSLLKREMMFLVVAKDSGEPPREAFVPVVLRMTDLPTNEEIYMGEIDMKIALISAIGMVILALAVGLFLYFGYCRKRRKIQSENYQKRVLDQQQRNMSNPLALRKPKTNNGHAGNGVGNSLRRSNKVRNMAMNITGPPPATNMNGVHRSSNVCLTPLDPVTVSNPLIGQQTATIRAKNVTWSPKTLDQVDGPGMDQNRRNNNLNGNGKVASVGSNGLGSNDRGYSIDPDTSVTPLDTYDQKNRSDTLQSNSSLTVYF